MKNFELETIEKCKEHKYPCYGCNPYSCPYAEKCDAIDDRSIQTKGHDKSDRNSK